MDLQHNWQVAGESFILESRYKVIDYLGSGAYGVVCSAHDMNDNSMVAIKKCKKIFTSRTLAKRTLREIRLLRNLNHGNVVKVKTLLRPLDKSDFSDIYIVFEIMETDLAQIIRSPQALKDQHVQYFTHQILMGLQYIHSLNIIHRDLKPRNMLVNSDCCLKLADFGLARVYNEQNNTKIVAMTEYVTTRWYRSPEILVGWGKYSSAIDMWAVGCIMAELMGRSPLFPGADSYKQMQLICQCTGKPSPEFIASCRKEPFRDYLNEMPDDIQTVDLSALYSSANPQAIELASKMLRMDPNDRFTAEEALNHPYLQSLRPTAHKSSEVNHQLRFKEQFSFEDRKLTIDNLRDELIIEVNAFNDEYRSPAAINNLIFSPQLPSIQEMGFQPRRRTQPPAQSMGTEKSSTGMKELCCGQSLLSCVESDYSVRGFSMVPESGPPKYDSSSSSITIPVEAKEDASGTVNVCQQRGNGYGDKSSGSAPLRTIPGFVAGAAEEVVPFVPFDKSFRGRSLAAEGLVASTGDPVPDQDSKFKRSRLLGRDGDIAEVADLESTGLKQRKEKTLNKTKHVCVIM